MCGIYGGINPAFNASVGEVLQHRGPDGAGERQFQSHSGASVVLGHRRLAILDLTSAGAQPMGNEDGTVWISFNGEIYNFLDLRRELSAAGHRFVSNCDTECLIHGYEEWGIQLLPRLRGMFAFALWDARRQEILLVRDRVGKKPLFYFLDERRLVFASEIKAILASSQVPRVPDPVGLDHYFTYFYFPPPLTAFRGIRKLEPAHWLRIRVHMDGSLIQTQGRYWNPLDAAIRQSSPSQPEAACEELRHLLAEAIRLRLISDVPLGAFLSGGLDSGSIISLAATDLRQPLNAFSITFPGNRHYDESSLAVSIANKYAASHHLLPVAYQIAEWLPTVVRHFDEPFGNPTAVLQYHLTRAARQHVTVALSGDGGDELFLGYPRYRGAQLAAYYRQLPWNISHCIIQLSRLFPETTTGWQGPRRVREFLQFGALPEMESYLHWIGYFGLQDKVSLYSSAWAHQVGVGDAGDFLRKLFLDSSELSPENRLSYVDINSFLACNVLEYSDRMSMANSLEIRCPFTDHHLLEWALCLKSNLKLRRGQSKWLLRSMMYGRLPAAVLKNPKQGFSPPLANWMRGQFIPLLDRWLGVRGLAKRDILQMQAMVDLRQSHERGHRDNSVKLWGLLALETWFRLYFDGDSVEDLREEIQSLTSTPSAALLPAVV